MTIRNAVETRLTETLELYKMERANPIFPDTLTHEYFYGKCMGILDMALSMGMDEDELTELYEPFRLRLQSLKSATMADEVDEADEAYEVEVDELEDMDAHCELWFVGEEWHCELYGEDFETLHHVDVSYEASIAWVDEMVAELLNQWESQWADNDENEDYTIEDELEDMLFEAARERRYGYDD